MAVINSFRDLIAWQKAMDLAQMVYMHSKTMPAQEQFGLTMQMRRAAVSIASNIAEGYARQSRTDYVRFLRIARGSLAELYTQIELATSLSLMVPNPTLHSLLAEEERILQALITSLTRSV